MEPVQENLKNNITSEILLNYKNLKENKRVVGQKNIQPKSAKFHSNETGGLLVLGLKPNVSDWYF